MTGRLRRLAGPLVRGREDDRVRAVWRALLPAAAVVLVGGALLPALVLSALDPGPVLGHPLANATGAAVALVVLALTARYLDRRPLAAYGLDVDRDCAGQFAVGSAVAALLVGLAWLLARIAGTATVSGTLSPGDAGSLLGGLALFAVGWLCVGVWEEIAFRGLLLTNAAEGLAARGLPSGRALGGAWLVSTVLFALVHAPASTVPGDASLAGMLAVWGLAGGLLGVAYVLTGRLATPVGGHVAFDLAVNNLLFAPASAGVAPPAVVRTAVGGSALYHPIGGLPMVGALLAGYALAGGWWLLRRRAGSNTLGVAGA
jgi:membrane protease YdiL (CAAX protease family)